MPHTAHRIRSLLAAVLLSATALLGLAACASGDAGSSGGASSAATDSGPLPTGTKGAANFDGGYLEVGTGDTIVDVYLDPMCPICGVFEATNGEQLAKLVDAGTITLRLHPMTFLNRASQGTEYSTRAAGALTCVAAADGTKTLPYLAELFAHQPEENSAGLTDTQLIALAHDAQGPDIGDCVTGGTYASWVQHANDGALAGPIEGADIAAVTGTPTVLVNGKSYQGPVDDAAALRDAIAAA